MTLRTTIADLVSGAPQDGGPDSGALSELRAALADEGFGDLPAEAFGTALVNYADTAPMDHADALAPIVTALGPTPEVSPLVDDAGDTSFDAFDLFAAHPPHLEPNLDDDPHGDDDLDDDVADLLDAFGQGDTPLDERGLDDSGFDDSGLDDDVDGDAESLLDDPVGDVLDRGPIDTTSVDDFDDLDDLGEGLGIDPDGIDTDTDLGGDDPVDLDFDV